MIRLRWNNVGWKSTYPDGEKCVTLCGYARFSDNGNCMLWIGPLELWWYRT